MISPLSIRLLVGTGTTQAPIAMSSGGLLGRLPDRAIAPSSSTEERGLGARKSARRGDGSGFSTPGAIRPERRGAEEPFLMAASSARSESSAIAFRAECRKSRAGAFTEASGRITSGEPGGKRKWNALFGCDPALGSFVLSTSLELRPSLVRTSVEVPAEEASAVAACGCNFDLTHA